MFLECIIDDVSGRGGGNCNDCVDYYWNNCTLIHAFCTFFSLLYKLISFRSDKGAPFCKPVIIIIYKERLYKKRSIFFVLADNFRKCYLIHKCLYLFVCLFVCFIARLSVVGCCCCCCFFFFLGGGVYEQFQSHSILCVFNPKSIIHSNSISLGGRGKGGGGQLPPKAFFFCFFFCLSAQSRTIIMIIPLYPIMIIILPQNISVGKKYVGSPPPLSLSASYHGRRSAQRDILPPPPLSKHPGAAPASNNLFFQGRSQDFHLGGRKRLMCAHAHHEREARSPS